RRVGLGVVGVFESQDVADVFDNRMLKTATGAEERPARFTCQSNGPQRAVHAGIGTVGDAPDSVALLELFRSVIQRGSRSPDGFDFKGKSVCRQFERLRNCHVRLDGRLEIADERNADARLHSLRPLLRLWMPAARPSSR